MVWKNSTMSCNYAMLVDGEMRHSLSYINESGETTTVLVTKIVLDGLAGKPIPKVEGDVMVIIKKVNNITGAEYSVTVDGGKYVRWKHGEKGLMGLIQNIFPELDPGQREFLMTGITPEEWDEDMGPDPDA